MDALLQIETFTIGPWQTNCYVLSTPGDCWVIDAGFEPQPILDHLEEAGLTPSRLILTHAHVDHIAGIAAIRQGFPELPIAIHAAERDYLTDASLNLSLYLAQPLVAPEATETLTHGQRLTLGELSFELRHTPGHSPGGLSLYQPNHGVAIVGDTLFAGSMGRFDFPTSDGQTLIRSIHEQLLTLPDATRILPGHGWESTIGAERASNVYLRSSGLAVDG